MEWYIKNKNRQINNISKIVNLYSEIKRRSSMGGELLPEIKIKIGYYEKRNYY